MGAAQSAAAAAQEEFNARLEEEADFSFRTVPLAATFPSSSQLPHPSGLSRDAANFTVLVLGCIETNFCKKICV